MLRESLFWAHGVFYGVLYHVRQLTEHVLGEWALRPGSGAPEESMHALNFTSFPRAPPEPPARLVLADAEADVDVDADADAATAELPTSSQEAMSGGYTLSPITEQQLTKADGAQKEKTTATATTSKKNLPAEKSYMSDASSSSALTSGREGSVQSASARPSGRQATNGSKQLIEAVPTLDALLEQQTLALTSAHTAFERFHLLVSQITADACMVLSCTVLYFSAKIFFYLHVPRIMSDRHDD